ncbi:MAG: GTPase [Candidatus Diapherotrites archaeon]
MVSVKKLSLVSPLPIKRKKIIIMGAAGRDFFDFFQVYANNPYYDVVCFTATQIPGIEGRKFPSKLAGKLYPNGIPIFPETLLTSLIKKFSVDEVIFAYSDVSHEYVMHKASQCLAAGTNFRLLGPSATMLRSTKPVIAVCAVRTGSGKSQTTRKIALILKKAGVRAGLIRHPMPYGNLIHQEVERFKKLSDLKRYKTTIEEREEYEEPIRNGIAVYAGVNYEKILRLAEKENDVILWDGGNNDFSFIQPNLLFVVVDPLRAGDEMRYHPGEVNLRMADYVIINKENSAHSAQIKTTVKNINHFNPRAKIIHADSVLTTDSSIRLAGKKVLVVEDGPSVTHGGMPFGAGFKFAQTKKAIIVDPRPFIVGRIKDAFTKYHHLEAVVPAVGYSKEEIRDLETTINNADCDYVISGTPINLQDVLKVKKPLVRVKYELNEKGKLDLKKILKQKGFLSKK